LFIAILRLSRQKRLLMADADLESFLSKVDQISALVSSVAQGESGSLEAVDKYIEKLAPVSHHVNMLT
jgi:hypothetical protein